MSDDVNECGCSERAPAGEYWRCPRCDAEWFPEGASNPTMPPEMPEKVARALRSVFDDEYQLAQLEGREPNARFSDIYAAIREALMKREP